MEGEALPPLAECMSRLEAVDQRQKGVFVDLAKAYNGAIYGVDVLAWAALNRSTALLAAFRHLINSRNLIAAGALLRLQLDTAMRFHAAFLVEEPHDFALSILRGSHVRNHRARDGNRLTDRYLVESLNARHNWFARVYERTSGYVHLSAVHIHSSLDRDHLDESGKFTVKVGAADKEVPEWIYAEACEAFVSATNVLLEYVEGWHFTKANPTLVARIRERAEAQKRSK